jgi:hypothetical protein
MIHKSKIVINLSFDDDYPKGIVIGLIECPSNYNSTKTASILFSAMMKLARANRISLKTFLEYLMSGISINWEAMKPKNDLS